MNELTEIGKVTKPQGLKGEMKVQSFSNNPQRFLEYSYVYLGEQQVKTKVLSSRIRNGFAYIMLDGINSIEEAEKYRNQFISIDKSQLPALDDGEYFIADLVGCTVFDDTGAQLGVVTEVNDYGMADIITLKQGTKKEISFPFLERVISSVDVVNKKIVVKSQEFSEVSVYED